jgi:hypothetical protein
MVMMPRTISAASLAAFAGSVAATLTSASTGAIPGLLPLGDQSGSRHAATKRPLLVAFAGPSRKLPRGSLLSLQA